METRERVIYVLVFIQVIISGTEADADFFYKVCRNEEHIKVIPFISTKTGDYKSDLTFHSKNPPSSEDIYNEQEADINYPVRIFVTIPLKNNVLFTLQLTKHEIHTSRRQKEWTSGNITYQQTILDDCFYQGHVIGQSRSFVAVSLCDGLSGYIQTENYELSVDRGNHRSSTKIDTKTHDVKVCYIPEEIGRLRPVEQQINRKKRQAKGNRKYVEVLIAADPSVVDFIGKDKIEIYLLSIMNIVNRIYKHDTLTSDVEIVAVKTLLINEATEKTIVVRNDARRTVDNFCRWTTIQAYNNQRTGGGYQFDVAVYITRTGIGPAGYAPITGMCHPGRSCAVVKDEGFTSAFILAHEVAHVIGLFHNGEGNKCSGRAYETSIMAPVVRATLQQYWWTECSDKRMKQVLPTLTCLNNKPSASKEIDTPLGQLFEMDEQCRLEFGTEFGLCPNYYVDHLCSMLWCSESKNRLMCRTKRGWPLEGSACGSEKWCQEGKCVYYGRNTAVNGEWSQWSNWTSCSADCGVGIRQRTRSCTDPKPEYGGEKCEGKSQEIDTCKTKKCESYTDIRKLQCSVLNHMPVRPGNHMWMPYQVKNEKKQCVLTCISNSTNEIATFDNIPVDNGTPCSYDDPNSICIDEICIKVGCDGKQNSTAKEDRCGDCNGDGSSCKTIKGKIDKHLEYNGRGYEYKELIVLPKGTRNIEIRETATSPHFIALQDPAYGHFLLNGKRTQGRSKEFAAKGAWFIYKNVRKHETLKSKGPTNGKLIVLIHPQNRHTKTYISYKYDVPADDYTHEKMSYFYKYKGWTDCSVTCGTGEQSLIYLCHSKETGEKVDRDKCKYIDDPTGDPVKCHRTACNAEVLQWAMLREWGKCNETCGEYGIQKQLYTCERETKDGGVEKVDLSVCSSLPPPDYTRPCNRVPCLVYAWVDSNNWTDCSETCGKDGTRSKIFVCRDNFGNDVSSHKCSNVFKPQTRESCNRGSCNQEWFRLDTTDRWSPCSVTCGWDGYQTKIKECKRITSEGDVENVEMERCSHLSSDNETRSCNFKSCDDGYFDWILFQDWSECSAVCGNDGLQFQVYKCFKITYENDAQLVDDSFCDDSISSRISRTCNRKSCFTYQWTPSKWAPCSASCGETGVQNQLYNCTKFHLNGTLIGIVSEKLCVGMKQKNTTRQCNRIPCIRITYSWILSKMWTECSEMCGNFGVQSQLYDCYALFSNDTMVLASNRNSCDDLKQPYNIRECNRFPCFTYRWSSEFDWSACTTSCGDTGFQTKLHVCEKVYFNGTVIPSSPSNCASLGGNLATRECNRISCVDFRIRLRQTTDMTECTHTCGDNGIRYYIYVCEKEFDDGRIEDTDMNNCTDITFPNVSYPCNRIPCLRAWTSSEWRKCSVTCGSGVQIRNVFCGSAAENLHPSMCHPERPASSQVCSIEPCPREDCMDRISICKRGASRRTCRYRGYKKMCCDSCRKFKQKI